LTNLYSCFSLVLTWLQGCGSFCRTSSTIKRECSFTSHCGDKPTVLQCCNGWCLLVTSSPSPNTSVFPSFGSRNHILHPLILNFRALDPCIVAGIKLCFSAFLMISVQPFASPSPNLFVFASPSLALGKKKKKDSL
jgi:hypothetical protein